MLRLAVEDRDAEVILRCVGSIEEGSEGGLLCAALRHRGRDLVVDLAEVEAIDAAGIGALIALQAAGIYLKLMNLSERVRAALRAASADSIFEICESRMSDKITAEVLA